ncbi:exported hypothetical protein [Syntrophobacter sp. SbD1]|nr:exported hypothetical protein [Syntrophobacter sp. SbD1]
MRKNCKNLPCVRLVLVILLILPTLAFAGQPLDGVIGLKWGDSAAKSDRIMKEKGATERKFKTELHHEEGHSCTDYEGNFMGREGSVLLCFYEGKLYAIDFMFYCLKPRELFDDYMRILLSKYGSYIKLFSGPLGDQFGSLTWRVDKTEIELQYSDFSRDHPNDLYASTVEVNYRDWKKAERVNLRIKHKEAYDDL